MNEMFKLHAAACISLAMTLGMKHANAETPKWDNDAGGVQVFLLIGQSNMVGHGKVEEGQRNKLGIRS